MPVTKVNLENPKPPPEFDKSPFWQALIELDLKNVDSLSAHSDKNIGDITHLIESHVKNKGQEDIAPNMIFNQTQLNLAKKTNPNLTILELIPGGKEWAESNDVNFKIEALYDASLNRASPTQFEYIEYLLDHGDSEAVSWANNVDTVQGDLQAQTGRVFGRERTQDEINTYRIMSLNKEDPLRGTTPEAQRLEPLLYLLDPRAASGYAFDFMKNIPAPLVDAFHSNSLPAIEGNFHQQDLFPLRGIEHNRAASAIGHPSLIENSTGQRRQEIFQAITAGENNAGNIVVDRSIPSNSVISTLPPGFQFGSNFGLGQQPPPTTPVDPNAPPVKIPTSISDQPPSAFIKPTPFLPAEEITNFTNQPTPDPPTNDPFDQTPQVDPLIDFGVREGSLIPDANRLLSSVFNAILANQPELNEINRQDLINRLQTELEFAPQFAQQQLDLAQQFDPQFHQLALDILGQFGPQIRDLATQIDPETEALRQQLTQQTSQDLAAGGQLTPSLRREIEQGIRSGQAARGNIFGNAPISAEALTKGSFAEDLKRQRQRAAQEVINLNAQTQVDPFSTILGRTPVRVSQNAPGTAQGSGFIPQGLGLGFDLSRARFGQNQAELLKRQVEQLNFEARRNRSNNFLDGIGGSILSSVLGGLGASVGGPIGGAIGSSITQFFNQG